MWRGGGGFRNVKIQGSSSHLSVYRDLAAFLVDSKT